MQKILLGIIIFFASIAAAYYGALTWVEKLSMSEDAPQELELVDMEADALSLSPSTPMPSPQVALPEQVRPKTPEISEMPDPIDDTKTPMPKQEESPRVEEAKQETKVLDKPAETPIAKAKPVVEENRETLVKPKPTESRSATKEESASDTFLRTMGALVGEPDTELERISRPTKNISDDERYNNQERLNNSLNKLLK